jgi:hypothetical protein
LIKYPSLVFSAACLLMVFRGVGKVIKDATRNATTEYERFSMKAIGYITFVTWTMLAMPQTLYHEGFMTWLQYEWISTCFDMLTKTVYAVTLLTGNFCILDVVQTIRAAQLKAEKRRGALQVCGTLPASLAPSLPPSLGVLLGLCPPSDTSLHSPCNYPFLAAAPCCLNRVASNTNFSLHPPSLPLPPCCELDRSPETPRF